MRNRASIVPLTLLAAATVAAPALADRATAGRSVFRQQCATCHTAEPGDNGGARGPDLHSVYGRKAASDSDFPYTAALRGSGLTWNAATLDRFLKSPTTVVPGTAMVQPVPDKSDRKNLIAYLRSIRSTPAAAPARASAPERAVQGETDWRSDAPGRVHRIDVANLPPPFATSAARNFPRLVERPENAAPALPPGFRIAVFARDLEGPRKMIVAANGDVLVAETGGGRVSVLRPSADGTKVAARSVFVDSLREPFGIAFYPNARNPEWLYVAETHRVLRYPYRTGDQKARGAPEVVARLPAGGGHFTRDVAFSLDGRRMFVSVGSASNVAEDLPKKSPAEIRAWEAAHGTGAAWGEETNRAAVLVFEVGSDKPGRIFAAGIRNCVSLVVQPRTGALWCTTNERDLLGDDLVPDYSTRVKEGGFYGWPWYYMGKYEDPRHAGERPDLASKVIVPDVPFQAHSAPLGLVFYEARSGASAFPESYVGDAFVVMHGSWNRSRRTGHKIVRLPMKNGIPTGEYVDFLTGFVREDGKPWARPVSAAEMSDGSLLMSDDGANLIYRISYSR